MRNKSPIFLSRPKVIHSTAPPKGALFLGVINGQAIYLSARDRSYHLVIIGAIGTGKTVELELLLRQDIDAGRGFCLLDPMRALFEKIMAYCCYRKALGFRVPDIIPFNPSDGSAWVLPINSFAPVGGDVSVQVDRRVSGMLKVWGQLNSDATPRLEKWLKVIFTTLINCGLTLSEAGLLIERHSNELRAFLAAGLEDGVIRRKLEQLSLFKSSEFLEQIESVENRLMRFLTSRHLTRIFGTGKNAVDFRKIMDEGKGLVVNLQPSQYLSEEQARLVGTFLLNDMYETALTRPSGARAFYTYVDEAAKFVSPELAQALEQCRQKGYHLTLAFQHLSQFKEDGIRVYKAIKHVRNKLVFAVPDREDALELAGDLFAGLAEPQLKFMHRHLSHLIEDVRETSTTDSEGVGRAWGNSRESSQSTSHSSGSTNGVSFARNRSDDIGSSRSRTYTRGRSSEKSTSDSRSENEQEGHSHGFSESNSRQDNFARNFSEQTHEHREEGFFDDYEVEGRSVSKGHSQSRSSGYSRTDTGSDSYQRGESRSKSTTRSSGGSTSLAWARSQQIGQSNGKSRTWSAQTDQADSDGRSSSLGETSSQQANRSHSTTDQPSTRHTPFWEQDPEHWSLEEQRWRASELLMFQDIGHWFFRNSTTLGFGNSPLPKTFYLMPAQKRRLMAAFYGRHNLPIEQADQLLAERREDLMNQVNAKSATSLPEAPAKPADVWNRQESVNGPDLAQRGRRGPRPKMEEYGKLAALVQAYGPSWKEPETLLEICDQFDQAGIQVPHQWLTRTPPARSWKRQFNIDPHVVKEVIIYRCKVAGTPVR